MLRNENSNRYNYILKDVVFISDIKKTLNDDIVKAGLVVNPLAIILAIIQFVIYLVK